jgi:5-methyltetrahydropteroyltriglutamate--homocysteine methyltransferase
VVLGLISSKVPRLESEQVLQARLQEASRIVPLERLALSPQCGFASGEAGNPLTPAEQEAKLRLVGGLARRVWPA